MTVSSTSSTSPSTEQKYNSTTTDSSTSSKADASTKTDTKTEAKNEPTVEPASDSFDTSEEPNADYVAFTAQDQTKVAPAAELSTAPARVVDTATGQAEFADNGDVIQVTRKNTADPVVDPAAVEPGVTAPEITPERATAITNYTAGLGNETRAPIEEGMRVNDALLGNSELGALNATEQEYLVNSALDRWVPATPSSDQPTNYAAIEEVARGTATDNPQTAQIVSDTYAGRALQIAAAPPLGTGVLQQQQAATLGTAAVNAAKTPEGQRALLDRLGTTGATQLASVLTRDLDRITGIQAGFSGNPADADERNFAVNQMLRATTTAAPSDASNAFVNQAFATLPQSAYRPGNFLEYPASGDTSKSMAAALAHQTHSTDPVAAQREADRLEGILKTEQGRDYLVSDKLSTQQRVANLAQLRGHENWDQAFFQQTGDVWANREIAEANAKERIDAFTTLRGDTPQTLSGTNLENLIGASMSLPPAGIPENETAEQRAAREEAVARGEHNLFATGEQQKLVQPIADAIRAVGGDNPQVTVVPYQFASKETGPLAMNLYRVTDAATGAERFVDNRGRTYDSFQHWQETNALPQGTVTYPPGGHLTPGAALQSGETPASSTGARVLATIDNVAFAGAMVAGGAIALGTGGLAAPAVLVGASAWGAARTVGQLNDLASHRVSLGLDNPEARGLWLNLAGSALGAGAGTASLAARGLTALGLPQARNAALAASALNGGAFLADSAAAANIGHQLITNWDNLSGSERASMALQLGFWGVGAGANVRMFSGNQRVSQALSEGLPQRGPLGFQAPDGFNPSLARNADGSFTDRFGNSWRPDPTTPGNWEVQPSTTTRTGNPLANPDAGYSYIPVRADGTRIGQPSATVLDVVNNHLLTPPRLPKRSANDAIREGHNEADLTAFLYGTNGNPAEGVITQRRATGVPGQTIIDYRLYQARPDGSYLPTLQNRTGTKTVWDPAIWTPDRLARHVQSILDSNPMTTPNYTGVHNINYNGVTYTTRWTNGAFTTIYVQ